MPLSITSKLIIIVVVLITFVTRQSDGNYTLPEGDNSKTANSSYNIDWFRHVKLFINIILPDDLPIDLIETFVNQKNASLNYSDAFQKVFKTEAATIILTFVGLIIALILPFILLGCCCACCCCSPKGVSAKHRTSRRLLAFFLVLFLFISLLSIAPCLFFLFYSSMRINEMTDNVISKINSCVNDTLIFVNDTKEEVTVLIKQLPLDNITDDLNDLENQLGIPIRNSLVKEITLKDQSVEIDKLKNDFQNAGEAMKSVNAFWKSPKFKKLLDDVENFTNEVESYCARPTVTCSKNLNDALLEIPPQQQNPLNPALLDAKEDEITTHVTQMDLDFTNILNDMNSSFDSIPSEVKTQAEPVRKDLERELENLRSELVNAVSVFDNVSNLIEKFDENRNSKLTELSPEIDSATKYSTYVTMGISGVIATIWILTCGGLFIASVFHDKHKDTNERSCGSNTGGSFLMFGVMIVLLTGTLPWILTSILFPIGSHFHQFVCKPLYDEPEFKFMKKLVSVIPVNEGAVNNFLPNGSKTEDLLDILNKCKRNEVAYKAFNLKSYFDINEELDVKKYFDAEKELNKLTSTLKLLSPLEGAINDLNQKLTDAETIIDVSTLTKTVDDFLNIRIKVKKVVAEIPSGTGIKLNEIATKLAEIMKELASARLNWKTVVNSNVSPLSQSIKKSFDDIKNQLPKTIENAVRNNTKLFADKLIDHAKKFVDRVIYALDNDIGGCRPMWNVFDTSRSIVCKDIVDPINGFWFSLGFCLFFFLPMSIVAFRLSKHYRRLPNPDPHGFNSMLKYKGGYDYE